LVHRSKWLPWLACAAVAAVGFPALAHGESESAADPPATASFSLDDNGFWDAGQADHADTEVDVATGGTVTWSYAVGAGNLPHTVRFDSPPDGAACASSPSVPNPGSDTLPEVPLSAPWTVTCSFGAAGTFIFHCSLHPQMHGTVKVTGAATPTPTSTATETPTATPTETAAPEPTPVAAASVTARDNAFEHADVTVKPGEYVHFSYPEGAASHNVDFKDAAQPVCKQTAPLPAVGASPPLPKYALRMGWAGDCRFDAPGVYTFVCDAHPAEMKGTVTVAEPQPAATQAVVRDTTPAPNPKPWASLDKPSGRNAKLATLLQGRLKLTARCAAVDKGTVTLTVARSVAKRLHLQRRTLAKGSSRCNGNGRFSATLKPSAAVKRALKRSRKAVKATVTLRLGSVTTRRAITLAAAR
jgi:plastocyanin